MSMLNNKKEKQIKKTSDVDVTKAEKTILSEEHELKEAVKKIAFIVTFRQLWYLLSGIRKKIPILLLLMMINSVVNLVGISLIIPFILLLQNVNLINTSYDISQFGFVKKHIVLFLRYIFEKAHFTEYNQVVLFVGILFIIMFIMRTVISVFVEYAMNLYTAYASRGLLAKIYTVILHMSYSYYLGRSTARTMFVLGLSGQSFGVIFGFLNLINDSLMVFFLVFLVVLWSPNIMLIMLSIVIIVGGTFMLIRRKLHKIAQAELILSRKSSVIVYQGIHNFTFSRLFGAESFFIRVFHTLQNKIIPLMAYRNILTSLPKVILEVIITFSFVFYAVYVIMRNPGRADEIIATAAVLAATTIKLMPAILRFILYFGELAGNQISVNEFYEEYKTALVHGAEEPTRTAQVLSFHHKIEVKNLHFSYPIFDVKGRSKTYKDSKEVLSNISFDIKKGETIGIVGGSGEGKTTLMHILMAFLDPIKGKVLVDGVSIHKNMRRWQKGIGYVPQDILLTDGSVLENTAFGMLFEDIDVKRVEEVLKTVFLWDTIQAMPHGVETNIGDAGKRLSGGQRQRLGIARALYRNPSILFFDEATSHLDYDTEKEVQRTISNLSKEITIIMIAHRINTLALCDIVYLMEGGTITFSGDYEGICKRLEVSKQT